MTPPQMRIISGRPIFFKALLSSGTRALCPAAETEKNISIYSVVSIKRAACLTILKVFPTLLALILPCLLKYFLKIFHSA